MGSDDIRRRLEHLKSRRTLRLVATGRRSGLPRPVTVWFVYVEDGLFVRTSGRTDWGKNLKANPAVQVRLADLEFSAEAELVSDVETLQKLRGAYKRKYHILNTLSALLMQRGSAIFFKLKTNLNRAHKED